MTQVLCTVDDRSSSAEAVRAAIDFCRHNDAEIITLVGVVRPMLAVTQPAFGEHVRRFNHVQYGLVRAARAARDAGLAPRIVFRAGDPAEEGLREAEAVGAEELFVADQRSPLVAAVTRRPRVSVAHLTLPARLHAKAAELRPAA